MNNSLQQDDACHESKTTVKKVQVCPVNVEAFKKRSTEKNCSMYQQCAQGPLVYHCVRNGGRLVEVCTPRTLITGIYKSFMVTISNNV